MEKITKNMHYLILYSSQLKMFRGTRNPASPQKKNPGYTIQSDYVVRTPLLVNILTCEDFLSCDTVFFDRLGVYISL